jgi:hypothetical protein
LLGFVFFVLFCFRFLQDIIHYSWLLDCVSHRRLLPFSSRYVIQGTDATTAALSREVDPYGDSYTLDTDRATIEGALAEVAAKRAHPFDGGAPFAAGENRINRAHAQAATPSTLQFHLAKSPPGQWTMCADACACNFIFSCALLIRFLLVR